jgi:hypothetical protein
MKMQRRRVQKLRASKLKEMKQEAERDRWFDKARPVAMPVKTWKVKRIKKDEKGSVSSEEDLGGARLLENAEINMVFDLLAEFEMPKMEVAQLALGATQDVFEKPKELGKHMRPLYIKGHLDGAPLDQMLVDGGACINIIPRVTFKKLGHTEGDLMRTNMMLSGFLGEASEAKGIISKELTMGSKMVPTTFFMVDVKGRYNASLIGSVMRSK